MKKLWSRIWWYFNTGTTIVVKWPETQIISVGRDHIEWYDVGTSKVEIHTNDPNDCYRPWMEEHVGVQGKDWEWSGYGILGTVRIVFRKGKEEQATMAAVKWG